MRGVSFRTVRLVAAKELLEVVRDRRTLFVALVLPVLLYPLMMLAVGPLVGKQRQKLQAETQFMTMTGPGAAALEAELFRAAEPVDAESGDPEAGDPETDALPALDVIASDDPDADLRSGMISLWIEVDGPAGDALDGDGSAKLVVHRDSSDDASRAAYGKWLRLVDAAELRLVTARLETRSLPLTLVDPISDADVRDVASDEQRAGYAFGKVLALLLVLMTLTSSFYPAVDMVAGEKERGTMETLLVAPCGRAELVLGKYLAVMAVTMVAALLNLFSMWLTMGPLVDAMGQDGLVGLEFNLGVLLAILALLVPMAGLFSAMAIALSTLARSVKEAQHYLSPLFLLVMPLAMVVVIPSVELTPTLAAVPITNIVLFFRDLMIGKATGGSAVIVFASTIISAVLALWGTVRLFLREETLFRGPEGTGSLLARPTPCTRPSAGAAALLFTVSLALVWYLMPVLPADDLLANALSTQALVVVGPCLILTWYLRPNLRTTFRYRRPLPLAMLLAVPIGLTAPVVNGYLQQKLVGEISLEGPFHKLAEMFQELIASQHWVVLLLVLAVLPAVCEELVYRGFILSGFTKGRRAGLGGILLTAALFALFHLYPEKWLGTFLAGSFLGLLAVGGRSLWPAVLAHALNNGSAVLVSRLDEDASLHVLYDHTRDGHGTAVAVSAVVLVAAVALIARLALGTPSPATPDELDPPTTGQ